MTAGENEIVRQSTDSSVAIPDRQSYTSLVKAADEAVAAGTELATENVRACGQPQRLLLPKGKFSKQLKYSIAFYFL